MLPNSSYHSDVDWGRRVKAALELDDPRQLSVLGGELERKERFADAWALLSRAGELRSPPRLPLWQGAGSPGRCLLVRRRMRHLGAELRNARFVGCAARDVERVIVATEKRLIPLLRRSFPKFDYVDGADESAISEADCETSYERLAMLYGSSAEQIERSFSPLVPPCADQLPSGLGIAWYSSNARKDLPSVEDWAECLKGARTRIQSLQYDELQVGLNELSAAAHLPIELSPIDQKEDIDGFAGLVASVRGVLTISNTTAHMAGALGVPCVVILDDRDHLMWPADRDRTPFYPFLRFIRRDGRPWAAVFEDGKRLLEGLMDQNSASNGGTLIGYHTDDPLYSAEAKRMEASAAAIGCEVDLDVIPAGDWLATVRHKANFLIRKRSELRGPVLYVDVDAVFHANPWPALARTRADVSFAVLLDDKARSGTIYLADTPGAMRFLEDWKTRLLAAPEAWDQHVLNDIVAELNAGRDLGYSWQNLAPGLCYIFDRAEETSGKGVDPIIEHLQASRDLTAMGKPKQQRRAERIRQIDAKLGLAGAD
jgi:hypothetical protein